MPSSLFPAASKNALVFAVFLALLSMGPNRDALGQESKASADPAFDILEFQIEGNTVLPTIDVEAAVMPFLGPSRHFSDVEGARKALEDVYQKSGYQTVFVDIPEQRVVGGVIRLHVLEGKVAHTRVVGARYFLLGEIRTRAAELAPGSVPDFDQVQKELAQLNRSPDRQVSPILKPGRTPGTVEVDLSVKDQLPLHGDLEFDNHASPFTTHERVNASLHYDNLWQQMHSLAVNYQFAPENPSEADVLYATYLWRFADSDDALSLYAIRSNSNIAVVGSSTILGNAKIYGARWIHSIDSGTSGEATYFHSLTFGFDRKDFGQTNISAQTGLADPLPAITYSPLSLTYGTTVVRPSRILEASVGLTTAPRGLFGNSDAAFRGRRAVGGASYLAWKYEASAEQWLQRRLSAYGKFEGQWTADPLINNEQFVTGGADSVRGYRESEVSGDRGWHGTLELRLHPFGKPATQGKRTLYSLLYADAAQVRLVDPQGPAAHFNGLASAGLGLRAQGWYGWNAAADYAHALRQGGTGVNGPITPRGANRVVFAVDYGF